MSFDDLAFPGFGTTGQQVEKFCSACEETRMVSQSEWICASCGERLQLAPNASNGNGGGNPMLAHLLQQTMQAAAAASSSGSAGSGSMDDLSGLGGMADQLQSLFIPSLNNSYADMIRAQQGVSIDALMQQLLQQESLNAPPTSKKFLENLRDRQLVQEDFVQLYLRFPGTLERDVFPTVATFGSGRDFVRKHTEAVAEHVAQVKGSKANTSSAVSAIVSSSSGTAASSHDTPATPSVSSIPAASTPAATPTAAAASTTEDDGSETPSIPPQEHSSGTLVASNPLSGSAPGNARLFRGKFVLMQRGVSSFSTKAKLVQDSLGKCLIVIQTEPDEKSWPFTITDSTGGSKDIVIPVLMVSKTDGEAIGEGMKKSTPAAKETEVKIMTRDRPLACSICRDDYSVGSLAVELPCSHHYCIDCIKPWLLKRSNCPLCRFALPTDAPKAKEDLRGPESNHAQLQRDMFT